MKIKKSELKQIIQEELGLLDEGVMEFFGLGEKGKVAKIEKQFMEWNRDFGGFPYKGPHSFEEGGDPRLELKKRRRFYESAARQIELARDTPRWEWWGDLESQGSQMNIARTNLDASGRWTQNVNIAVQDHGSAQDKARQEREDAIFAGAFDKINARAAQHRADAYAQDVADRERWGAAAQASIDAPAKARRKKEREAGYASGYRTDLQRAGDVIPSARHAYQENTIKQMVQEELEAVLAERNK